MELSKEDTAADSLQAQLEHWQGVATICETSKQEELSELQRKCDQEIQSLQEAFRETAAQYEARIAELAEWRRDRTQAEARGNRALLDMGAASEESLKSTTNSLLEPAEGGSPTDRREGEEPRLLTEGYFSQHCDTASLTSFSLDTPSLPRRPHPQEDTASLVSTGTLVPEAIYLPPPGHQLVTHSDWEALNSLVSELQIEVSRLQAERLELEKELDTQTNHTHKQVSLLQSQLVTSEALLQELQKYFSQSQNTIHSRLAELSVSQRKVCSELSRLKGEDAEDDAAVANSAPPPVLQGVHCEERLRIEIVNLKDQLDTRTEESEVLEVRLSSLKTETERIQSQKESLEAELQACRTELQGLRVALSHLQGDGKTLSSDKAALQQQCLELRSRVISLRSQADTSQAVQRDFVTLSQSLQVKLELIRQADTLDQVRGILGEGLCKDSPLPTDQ